MYKDIPFKGEEARIEFAGFVKDIDTKAGSIGKISYIFSGQEGTSGKLIRQQQQYWEAIKEEEEEVVSGAEVAAETGEEITEGSEELLSDVVGFSINYCYKTSEEREADLEWLPAWMPEETIPAGIRLELVLRDDYAPGGKRTFTKRIRIPVGEIGNLEELE